MASNQIVMNFHSDAVADNTLLVATAEGVEALAQPFSFALELVSADPGLDLAAILRVNARLSLNRTMDLGDGRSGDIAYDYHGILTDLHQSGRVGNGRYRYRAVLRSHLWKLACTRRSRIFTDKSVPELLTAVLDEAGIAFKFKLADQKSYPINPYVVQYEETDLDFISRWMEHVGISYYYDAEGDLGTLVVIDNAHGYVPINPYDLRVVYDDQATTGVWSSGRHQRIRRLDVEETRLPKRVQLKEYNYEAPANELKYETEVDAQGLGTWYEYNSNYRTESEAKFLLGIRRGNWLGRRRRLNGLADHRSFQPGRTFTLKEHFNPHISDVSYVLIEVRHHISQVGGGDIGTTGEYTCDFIAMGADLPHRPERNTAWPSIHGVVNARVAGGALGFAELDEMGRYKVDVDYDLNDQTIGKVRMAQPSVGENAGMHFPLRKHTEVLLGHIDGDPDKPVILGAVHDGEKTNLLDKDLDPLGTKSRIKSQGGNIIEMDDDSDRKHLVMANGNYNTLKSFGRPSYNHTEQRGDGEGSANADARRKAMTFQQFMASTGGPQGAKPPTPVTPQPSGQTNSGESVATSVASSASAPEDPTFAAVAAWLDASSSSFSDASITVAPVHGTPPMDVTFTVNDPDATKEYRWTYQETGGNQTEIAIWNSSQGNPATHTFTVEQNAYVIRCFQRDLGSTAAWTQVGSNVNLRTDLLTSADDPEVANFYTSVLGNYAARSAVAATATTPAVTQRDEKPIYWNTGYLNIASWSSTAKSFSKARILDDFRDLYKSVGIVQGTHYGNDDCKVPQSFLGRDPIVTQGAASVSVPPGRGASRDPDLKFANFTGSQGGEQVLTFGDSLELVYGHTWSRQYGDSYSWQSGDAHDYHPNGNSYTYFSGDSVTWLQGDNREWEYATNKKSYSYVENESSYSKVKTKSTSVSEVEASDSTETVYGVAKSVANVAIKQDYEDYGASLTLQCGGVQFEMSLNGPKLTIEGAISATFTIAAAFELTTGYKCEVNLAAKHEFNPVDSLELKTASQKATALEDAATALETTKKALNIEKIVADIAAIDTRLEKTEIGLTRTTTKLTNNLIALQNGTFIYL